jgi:hypothetical protein
MLIPRDYNNDGVEDTIVIQDWRVYLFNGFLLKDRYYAFRWAFLDGNSEVKNKQRHEVYDVYSVAKAWSTILIPDASRQRRYELNYHFTSEIVILYSTVPKYQLKTIPLVYNTTTVILTQLYYQ